MYKYIKRLLDLILSFIALIILSPLFLLIGFAIKYESPGPVFFTQQRVGTNKKSFNIYKFRTMYIDSPENSPSWMLEDADKYITKIGKVIRKRSIDELPQLVNILKGDMSFIGPRPVVWAERELINERFKLGVYSVKPGLTGMAQISGRDLLHIKDKAKIDALYIENLNLKYDLKIFLNTIIYVMKREGIVEGAVKKGKTDLDTSSSK